MEEKNLILINYKQKINGYRSIRYNFNLNSPYHAEVALLRQIEHAVGYSADADILKGTTQILDDFRKTYGKDVFRYVKHVGNQITRNSNHGKGLCEKMITAQNLILERVFNKDFPKELTLENAHEYMKRLKEMEQHRAKISGDNFYEEFYTDKYKVVKAMLLQQGYEASQIEEMISEYKPMQFYPTRKENKLRETTLQDLAEEYAIKPTNFAVKAGKNNIKEIEEENLKRYVLKNEKMFLEVFKYEEAIVNGGFFSSREGSLLGKGDDIFFDCEKETFVLNQDGQIYQFEEIPLQEGFVDKVNLSIKSFEELHQNAMAQEGAEMENTKQKLFQKVKEWISMKQRANKEQEGEKKVVDIQREDL